MAMMFRWVIRHFPTVAAFRAYLATLSPPSWATGVTVHHTLIPTVAQWRGRASMEGMGAHYRDVLHWDSGPQVFAAPDGIWQGTPVTQVGVHAGPCNDDKIAVEVVGNYDRTAWSGAIKTNAEGAIVALLDWLKLAAATEQTLVGHRDCMPGQKTCPGRTILLPDVRKRINDLRAPVVVPPLHDANVIGVRPSISVTAFQAVLRDHGQPLPPAETSRIYTLCQWLEVDPAFLLALWLVEGGDPFGSSELQQQTRMPINRKVYKWPGRLSVTYNGEEWEKLPTWQLGLMQSVLILKTHGDAGRTTVRQIIAVHAPARDGNDEARIVEHILRDMGFMQRRAQ
jgi:hypothetical protein